MVFLDVIDDVAVLSAGELELSLEIVGVFRVEVLLDLVEAFKSYTRSRSGVVAKSYRLCEVLSLTDADVDVSKSVVQFSVTCSREGSALSV